MTATPLSIEAGNVAQWVWKTSLEATLLIAVVFLIGWAAGRKLPPRWRYGLGLLILARLVLPITLPGAWGLNLLVPDDLSEPRWTQGYDAFEHSRSEVVPAPVLVESPRVREQVPAGAPSNRAASWSLSGFWAAGVLLVFGIMVARMIRFMVRIRGAAPVVRADSLELLDHCRASIGVTRAITLLEMEGLGTPALYGVFRPRLLLPHGFLDRFSPREIRLVFLHELAHLKAHDILLNWLIALAGAIHWFNPVTWLALRRLRHDREILRDAQVLHRLDPRERATYGQTLLKLSETLSGGAPCPSFIPVVNHRSQITRRILMITRYRKESRASTFGLVVAVTLLALVTFSTPGSELAGESTLGTPASYPWSEDSEYVRVEKDLLERISIRSVTITNGNTVQFVLAPEFVHACLLTSEEIERMNAALTNALHEYRTVQGQHFEPMDDEATFESARKELPYAKGTFKFSLKPFEAEARGIRERLKSDVVATLGSQRAELFWQQGEMFLKGEMNTTNHARFLGQTHRFSVLTRVPGPLVDITVTYSGGSHGRPYGEALDPYAPEKLKPILKRWREWIAGQPQGSFVWTVPASEQTVIEIPPGLKLGRWNDASEYVDLPKPVVMALKVPGLTDDEKLSPEAIALLGLATNEVLAVNELYQHMKLRTEAVERANLVKPDPEKMSFILRAFPEQAAALKREWLTNLTERIGAGRAELLDQFIRTSLWTLNQRDHKAFDWDLRMVRAGPRWFDRGQFDLRIYVKNVKRPDGLYGLQIRYESDLPEGGDDGGPDIPPRFRHLLTPDILNAPGPL
ncbi:MAG: M56 family metallopeptidase [Verrucomicrobia bacterium]|nr:M56 family metallopeptidase [Verrucomicrobiota bacterium]